MIWIVLRKLENCWNTLSFRVFQLPHNLKCEQHRYSRFFFFPFFFNQSHKELWPLPTMQHVLSEHCIVVYGGSCQCEAIISASAMMDFSLYDCRTPMKMVSLERSLSLWIWEPDTETWHLLLMFHIVKDISAAGFHCCCSGNILTQDHSLYD